MAHKINTLPATFIHRTNPILPHHKRVYSLKYYSNQKKKTRRKTNTPTFASKLHYFLPTPFWVGIAPTETDSEHFSPENRPQSHTKGLDHPSTATTARDNTLETAEKSCGAWNYSSRLWLPTPNVCGEHPALFQVKKQWYSSQLNAANRTAVMWTRLQVRCAWILDSVWSNYDCVWWFRVEWNHSDDHRCVWIVIVLDWSNNDMMCEVRNWLLTRKRLWRRFNEWFIYI